MKKVSSYLIPRAILIPFAKQQVPQDFLFRSNIYSQQLLPTDCGSREKIVTSQTKTYLNQTMVRMQTRDPILSHWFSYLNRIHYDHCYDTLKILIVILIEWRMMTFTDFKFEMNSTLYRTMLQDFASEDFLVDSDCCADSGNLLVSTYDVVVYE